MMKILAIIAINYKNIGLLNSLRIYKKCISYRIISNTGDDSITMIM